MIDSLTDIHRDVFTASLTTAQNEQLLVAWYKSVYCPSEDTEERYTSRLILFRALLHGWSMRFLGKYERSGKYIGFGNYVRKFGAKNADRYKRCFSNISVQNRIDVNEEGNWTGIRSVT